MGLRVLITVDIAGEQRAKQLTIEEVLARHVSLATSTGVWQIQLGHMIFDGLLVKLLTGVFRNTRYVHGAEVLIAD